MFNGRLKELNNVLVDNFLDFEEHTCFFLSHCHADHMLNIESLLTTIKSKNNRYLYCSPISRLILLNKYKNIDQHVIKELTSSTRIEVPQNKLSPSYHIMVTPTPAGHCPGSIMFLFETINKTILYTGDVRINKGDVMKFKALHSNEFIKPIDKLYFDATFFSKSYWYFPARSKVVCLLINVIQNWLQKDNNHQILLHTSAIIGYEFAFIEIARKLKCRIHVTDFIYNTFLYVPEIGYSLTNNCKTTKIHAVSKCNTICFVPCDSKHVLHIKLSAQWYNTFKGSSPKLPIKKVNNNFLKICYATHCSGSEIQEVLDYLQPKEMDSFTSTLLPKKNTLIDKNLKANNESCENEKRLSKVGFLPLKSYKFKLKFSDSQKPPTIT